MSAPIFRVTLVQLKTNATALAAAGEKQELGLITAEDVFRLAGNLAKLNLADQPKAEPGLIVFRGDKGWRIAMQGGRLVMHKSTSLFDEFWSVENAGELAQLPPFAGSSNSAPPKTVRGQTAATKKQSVLRTVFDVVGLFVLGIGLIVVGFWFGLPHRKLSDLPPDIIVVTADSERTAVFNALAGSYVTGRKNGDAIVTISANGRVSLGRIGKDGRPTAPPQIEEQAQAARKGNLAVVVTSFGNIAEFPPDAVNVGTNKWRRLAAN